MIQSECLSFQEKRALVEQKIFSNCNHSVTEEEKGVWVNGREPTPRRHQVRLAITLNAIGLSASEISLKQRLTNFGVSIDRVFNRNKFCICSDKANEFGDETWRLIQEILCIRRPTLWFYEGGGGLSYMKFIQMLNGSYWSAIELQLKMNSDFVYKHKRRHQIKDQKQETGVKSFKISVSDPQKPSKGFYEAVSYVLLSSPYAHSLEVICDNKNLDMSQFILLNNLRNLANLNIFWITLDSLHLIKLCKFLPALTNLKECSIINARFEDETYSRIFAALCKHPSITCVTLLSGVWNSQLLPRMTEEIIDDLAASKLTNIKTWPVKTNNQVISKLTDCLAHSQIKLIELRRLRGVSPAACNLLKRKANSLGVQIITDLY